MIDFRVTGAIAVVFALLPCAALAQTAAPRATVSEMPAELQRIAPERSHPPAAERPRDAKPPAPRVQPNNTTIKGTVSAGKPVNIKPIPGLHDQVYLKALGNALDAGLKKQHTYVGYALTIVMPSGASASRVDGMARRAPDTNPRAITADDKISIASSSKTITAATLMSVLNAKKIGLDTPVYTYLPPSWKLGSNIKSITFRELLTHRSGIRCGDVTYTGLRDCIAGGVNLADKPVFVYENTNFALFRIIIPRLRTPFAPSSDAFLTSQEAMGNTSVPEAVYARSYVVAVNELTFGPIGFPWMYCAPTGAYPALSYESALATSAGDPKFYDFTSVNPGEIWGDMTLVCGSQGWELSSKQLAAFMHELQTGTKIVPALVAETMRVNQLGMYQYSLPPNANYPYGLTEWDHNGYHPAYYNKGEIHTLIMYFSNGVTIGLVINSPYGPDADFYTPIRNAVASTKP